LLLKGSEFSTVSFYGVHLLTTTGISTGQFVFIGGTGRFQQAQGSANYIVNQDLDSGVFDVVAQGSYRLLALQTTHKSL
jgi:hypothetical protein